MWHANGTTGEERPGGVEALSRLLKRGNGGILGVLSGGEGI
jgi:hypothetical protein